MATQRTGTGRSAQFADQTTVAPVAGNDLVNKTYADAIPNAISGKGSVQAATTAPLPANTYANGSSGVGATLTKNAPFAALPAQDGVALAVGDRLLVKDEADQKTNGIYVVTSLGSGAAAWVLTRATDADTGTKLASGTVTFVVSGTVNGNLGYEMTTTGVILIGASNLVWSLIGSSIFIQKTGVTAFTGDQSFGGNEATNAKDPTAAQSLATKNYVDTVAQGLAVKAQVRVATTGALPTYAYANGVLGVGATLTKTAPFAALPAQDGITLVVGDRILVKNETGGNQPYNGVYIVTALGSGLVPWILTRAPDDDTAADQVAAYVFVAEGTVNNTAGFVQTTGEPITMGVTNLVWTQFTGAAEITAGAGLSKSGNTLSIATAGVTNAMLANMAASTIKGNNTGAPAAPLDLTVAQVNALLGTLLADGSVAMTGDLNLNSHSLTNVTNINGIAVSSLMTGGMMYGNGELGALTLVADTTYDNAAGSYFAMFSSITNAGFTLTWSGEIAPVAVSGTVSLGSGGKIIAQQAVTAARTGGASLQTGGGGAGGAGGGSCGALYLYAKTITGTGTISANGKAGVNGGNGGATLENKGSNTGQDGLNPIYVRGVSVTPTVAGKPTAGAAISAANQRAFHFSVTWTYLSDSLVDATYRWFSYAGTGAGGNSGPATSNAGAGAGAGPSGGGGGYYGAGGAAGTSETGASGTGGGGGGGGAGGGAAGCVCIVITDSAPSTLTVSSNGGNGGNGGAEGVAGAHSNAGGAGGGGGGIAILAAQTGNTSTVTATGGTKGTKGGGTATDGSNGSAGIAMSLVK